MKNFRFYKQKLVYTIKECEEQLGVDIDLTCNPDCLDETGKLVTIAGMLSEKLKQLLSDEEFTEFKNNLEAVKKIYIAVKGLSPDEEYIVSELYLKGVFVQDVEIYTRPNWYSKTKHFELKKSAWVKIMEIIH